MSARGVRQLVLSYLTLASVYILFSDRLLFALAPDSVGAARVGTYKGLGFVVVTSLALFAMLTRLRRVQKERYRALFEGHHAVMLLVDPQTGEVVDANPAAAAFYGFSRRELVSKRVTDLDVGPDGHALQAFERAATDPGAAVLRRRHQRADGEKRDVELRADPVQWGARRLLFVIVHDETERNRSERALERSQRLYEMLSGTNNLIVHATSRHMLYGRLCEIAVERSGFLFAWAGTVDEAGRVHPEARAGEDHGYIDSLQLTRDADSTSGQGPTGVALRKGEKVVANDFLAMPALAPWHEAARKAGIVSSAALPLRCRGVVVGVLNLYAAEAGFFGPDELSTLDEMASDVSFALDNLENAAEKATADESLRIASQVVESSPVVLFRWRASPGWPVEYVSSNVMRWGYTPDELRSGAFPYESLIVAEDRARVSAENEARTSAGASAFVQEYRIRTRSGGLVHVVDRTFVLRDADGRVTHYQGLVSDETARIQAESARSESEHILSMALAQSPLLLARQDRDLTFTWLLFPGLGERANAALGHAEAELLPPEEAAEIARLKRAVMTNGQPWRGEVRMTFAPGETRYFDAAIEPLLGPTGDIEGVWSAAMDVTEQRRLDDERRASELRYRAMFEANPHAMWLSDRATGQLLAVNDAALAQYGYGRDELLALRVDALQATPLPPEVDALNRLVSGSARLERHRRRDGGVIDVEVSSQHFAFAGHEAELVLALDVTDSVAARRALADEKERFRALTEQSFVGVFLLEGDTVAYANPRCEQIFGTPANELPGRSIAEFIAPADLPRLEERVRALQAGELEVAREEFKGVRADGGELVIGAQVRRTQLEGRPALLGVLQDITEKHRADAVVREYVSRLERAIEGTVGAVSLMVELRDPYTAGHERRVGILAAEIAKEMGLDDSVQQGLIIAGSVHDAGKIGIPAEILTKPGKLTRIEYEMVKGHAEQGYEVLKNIDFPWPVALVARQHHERIDGSGYPLGLKGNDILLEARIVAVADVVESMASHRPYRPTRGLGVALDEIKQNAGKLYDPDVAAACLRLFWERGYTLPE